MDRLSPGTSVVVTTSDAQKHTGCIYAYDQKSRLLTLISTRPNGSSDRLPATTARHTVTILPVRSIKDFVLSHEQTPLCVTPAPISWQKVWRREQRAIRERLADIGHPMPTNISDEAQAIFIAISKTLPCSWCSAPNSPPIILVMDEISICAPYTSANCRGTLKTPAAAIERVKKVVRALCSGALYF